MLHSQFVACFEQFTLRLQINHAPNVNGQLNGKATQSIKSNFRFWITTQWRIKKLNATGWQVTVPKACTGAVIEKAEKSSASNYLLKGLTASDCLDQIDSKQTFFTRRWTFEGVNKAHSKKKICKHCYVTSCLTFSLKRLLYAQKVRRCVWPRVAVTKLAFCTLCE